MALLLLLLLLCAPSFAFGVVSTAEATGGKPIIDGPHTVSPTSLDALRSTAEECCVVARLPTVFSMAPRGSRWPIECQWLDALVDFDFDARTVKPQYLPLLGLVCDKWEALGGGNELTSAKVQAAAKRHNKDGLEPHLPASFDWHVELVEQAAFASIPNLRFAQYTSLVVQRCVCESYHRGKTSRADGGDFAWAPICGWDEFEARGGSCDCVALLREQTANVLGSEARRADEASLHGGSSRRDRYVRELFQVG